MKSYEINEDQLEDLANVCERWLGEKVDPDDPIAQACPADVSISFYCDVCEAWFVREVGDAYTWPVFVKHIRKDLQTHIEWAWINEKL